MQRYDSYKDSGVKWLGEIPGHWEVKRIKHCGQFSKGKLPKDTNLDGIGFPIIGASEMNGKEPSIFTEDLNIPQCAPNDILILWDGANAGLIANNKNGVISSTAVKFTCCDSSVNKRFLFYLIKNYQRYYKDRVGGTTIPHMNIAFINDTPMLVPLIDEQESIANYLDIATAKIDAAIAQQQKMIDLLDERKQIIINNAVTRGLNPNVKMKDSGVEWIGEIPCHWEVKRGKFLFRIINELSITGDEELLTVSDRTGITPRSMKNVNMFMSDSLVGYKKCQVGDICSNIMWMWHGAVGVTKYDGIISPSYGVYRQQGKYYADEFLDLLLRLPKLVKLYSSLSSGLTESRLRLYPTDFMNIFFFIPPIDEQSNIIAFIDKVCHPIDQAIDAATQQISLLQERKQIIINEVVTGKVKVV